MIDRLMHLGAGRIALFMAALMLLTIVASAGAAAVTTALASTASTSSGAAEPDDPPTDLDPLEPTDDGSSEGESAAPAPAVAAAPPLPAGCESVFSPAMAAQLESYGVVLNPSWAQIELADSYSFDDALLVEFMSQRSNLQCLWVSPNGGSGVGIETRIIPVTAEEGASVQARLAGLGYTPISELGSTRYVFGVTASETGAAFGESHIVVGGYWFATSWLELGITGYTADMVTTLLG